MQYKVKAHKLVSCSCLSLIGLSIKLANVQENEVACSPTISKKNYTLS
jgi:hypothetical protein